jgi:hypothetical protein
VRACLILLCLAACGDGGGAADAGAPDAFMADAGPVPQGSEPRGAVAINEVAPRPEAGEDWIELVNRSTEPVDLSGCFVTDAPDRLDHYYEFPAGTTLAPGAYLIVWAGGAPVAGEHHTTFGLSEQEGAFLLDPDGVMLDGLWYLQLERGPSLARVPDGEGLFYATAPSPGAANPETL